MKEHEENGRKERRQKKKKKWRGEEAVQVESVVLTTKKWLVSFVVTGVKKQMRCVVYVDIDIDGNNVNANNINFNDDGTNNDDNFGSCSNVHDLRSIYDEKRLLLTRLCYSNRQHVVSTCVPNNGSYH